VTPKLDIHSFLTPDTSAHCKKIGHEFSPLDMAVIVAYSRKTVRERMDAWQAIIDGCPDMPIHGNHIFRPRGSLHEYLKQCIAWHRGWVDGFCAAGPGTVFRPLVREKEWDWREEFSLGSFSSVQRAVDAARNYAAKHEADYALKIVREEMDKEDGGERDAPFNLDGDLLDIYTSPPDGLGELEDIYIDLPVPFERGDIVTDDDGSPCVVTGLPHTWDNYRDYVAGTFSDGSDMSGLAFSFQRAQDGAIAIEHSHPSLHRMEYYRGELKGRDRFLKDYGRYIKEVGADDGFAVCLIESFLKYAADAEAELRTAHYYEEAFGK